MKTCLITGGSRGIGAACVRLFRAQGCRVAFFYHVQAAQAALVAAETGAMAICCDVSDERSVCAGMAQAQAALGHLDALVLNAGVSQFGLLPDCDPAEWRRVQAVNLDGAYLVLREALPGMIARKAGAVVAVSSIFGVTGASCEAAYAASKAGLIGLIRSVAREVGPSNIRANCVAPGFIQTEMNARLSEAEARAFCEDTALLRPGLPAEVASVVYFLASDAAAYVTAQTIAVDGGL